MLSGSIVALVTPLKGNSIDYNALDRLLDFHLENGTDGLLVCGTTGETPALAGDEKEQLIRTCIRKLKGKLPVMVGTGSNNLSVTLSMTARAADWGADYALVITPYYNKPNQEGMFQYFTRICERTDIPVVIYNVPGRTGVNILPETVLRLAESQKNIVAVKEASGDLYQASVIARDAPDDFAVLSGDDFLNAPLMSVGAVGAISVTANVVPDRIHRLVQAGLEGDLKEMTRLHHELIDLNKILFIDTNPIPVKQALALMEMIHPDVRLPLWKLNDRKLDELKSCLAQYGLIET